MKLEPLDFQWDEGNWDKNWFKHQVSTNECEEVFFDEKKYIIKDRMHSGSEKRWTVFGKTKSYRTLFIVFTVRSKMVRIISARDADKKEKAFYEKKAGNTKIQK